VGGRDYISFILHRGRKRRLGGKSQTSLREACVNSSILDHNSLKQRERFGSKPLHKEPQRIISPTLSHKTEKLQDEIGRGDPLVKIL